MFRPYLRPMFMWYPCAQPPNPPPNPPPDHLSPTHAAMVAQSPLLPQQYAPVTYSGHPPDMPHPIRPPYPQPYCDSSSPYWQMMPPAPEYFGTQATGSMDVVSSNPFFRALMQQQEAADHALKTRRVEREQSIEWHVTGMPWFRPEDILVSIEGRHVMLTAKREEVGQCRGVPEDCGPDCGYTIFRQAHKCFTLPETVDSTDVRAHIEPGPDALPILIINAPKLAFRRV